VTRVLNQFAVPAALAVVVAGFGFGCGSSERKLANRMELSGGLNTILVSSSAFRDDNPVPRKYTADGENVSIGTFSAGGRASAACAFPCR
jgi:hypothetical protein